MNNQEKRSARKKATAEDFTPLPLVNEILDRLSKESNNSVWQEDKTFIDPSCGNGNFLIEVLRRKLDKGHNPLKAISTIFGTDIMLDNIQECRLRLLKVLINHIKTHKLPKPNQVELVKILGKNIVCTPLDKFPNGSLDYNFEFKYAPNDLQCKQALKKIVREKLMEQVSIDTPPTFHSTNSTVENTPKPVAPKLTPKEADEMFNDKFFE